MTKSDPVTAATMKNGRNSPVTAWTMTVSIPNRQRKPSVVEDGVRKRDLVEDGAWEWDQAPDRQQDREPLAAGAGTDGDCTGTARDPGE